MADFDDFPTNQNLFPDPFNKPDQDTPDLPDQADETSTDQETDSPQEHTLPNEVLHPLKHRRSLGDHKRPVYLDNYQCNSSLESHWWSSKSMHQQEVSKQAVVS
ncbi:unnamed protein product [Amaranthus hypochondriacus]